MSEPQPSSATSDSLSPGVQRGLSRRFLRLTALNILSNVTVPLAGLVDTAMLGHLPDIRFLAGVALSAVLFDYLYWGFGFLRMGMTGTTAQAMGRGDHAEAHRLLYRGVLLGLILGIVIVAGQSLLAFVGFGLLSGTGAVELAGRDYFAARVWGAPAVLANFALLGWFLGREESQKALWMNIAANLTNVVLNYVFIIRLGWAAAGAGWATMLSQYAMALTGWVFFAALGKRHPWIWSEIADRVKLTALVRLNRDILIRTLGLITTFALFTNFSALLGTLFLAANSVLLRFLSVAAYAIDGAAFAAESLMGQMAGAAHRAGLQRVIRLALSWSAALALAFILGLWAAGNHVWALVTSHADVQAMASQYRWGLFACVFFGAFAYAYDGIFLGLTAGRLLRNGMLFCVLAVFSPPAIWAVQISSNGLLWAALAAFMFARAAVLALFGRGRLRQAARGGAEPP